MAPEPPVSRPARAWHGNGPGPKEKARPSLSRRRRKIFIVLAVMLALVGSIAAWLLFLRPFTEPVFRTFALTKYKLKDWPFNAFAEQDGKALLNHFPDGKDAHDSQESDLLRQALAKLKDNQGPSLVVHLCGYARVHEKQLYLVPADADRNYSDKWLAMARVFKDIESHPAAKKLLILDITHPVDDLWQVSPDEDIAGQVVKCFKTRKHPGTLMVLCACSPGEVSLLPPELPLSLFGYYLDEGLRGYADGYNSDQKREGRVSVKELAEFVKARVDRWAVLNRGLHQTPLLLGADQPDFDLAAVPPEKSAEPKSSGEAKYPAQLKECWQARDKAIAQGMDGLAPGVLQRFEAQLLVQEQQWRRGGNVEDIQGELVQRLQDFTKDMLAARDRLLPKGKPAALLLAAARGTVQTRPKVKTALDAKLKKLDGLKEAERAKAAEALVKEFVTETKKEVSQDIAWTVLQAVLKDDSPWTEQYHFAFLQRVFQALAQRPVPEYAESIYFQRLADLKFEAKDWPRAAIRLLFEVVQEGGQARACRPREFPWVRHLLDQAVAQQTEGEDLLFASDPEQLSQAQNKLTKALQIYTRVNETVDTVRTAQKTLDEAWRRLPAYVPYLVAQSHWNAAVKATETWNQALGEAQNLALILLHPPTAKALAADDFDEKMNKLKSSGGALRNDLDGLAAPLQPGEPAKELGAKDPDTNRDAVGRAIHALRAMDAILDTAWPSISERTKLLNSRRQLALALHQQTRQLDQADNNAQRVTTLPQGWTREQVATVPEQLATRARLAAALLRLAGLQEDADKVDDLIGQAAQKPQPAAWTNIITALDAGWTKLAEQAHGKDDLAQAARATTILQAKGYRQGGLEDPNFNPTLDIRLGERHAYWQWQADWADKQSKVLTDASLANYKDFFRQLADDFRAAAE